MRFGINSWFLQELSVKEALREIKKVGFEICEVWMEHILNSKESCTDIAKYAKSIGIDLTLHSTSYDINITSINKGIRDESLRQAKESIVMASELEAKVLVIHPGRLSSGRSSIDEYWDMLHDAFVKIDNWADLYGVKVGIEAMEKRSNEVYMEPLHVEKMLSQGWRNIGLTLDIAHTYTLCNPLEYIGNLDPKWIYHVHLSDGDKTHVHLPLGKGEIEIPKVLNALKKVYEGIVIIEGYVPNRGLETIKMNFRYLKLHKFYIGDKLEKDKNISNARLKRQ